MQYLKSVWMGVYTALVGMKITFGHLFQKNVTVQYPDERYPIPDNARNRLYLDAEACNGCTQCAKACPVNCITIETMKVVPGDPDQPKLKDGASRKLWVPKYDIDFAKCCFCSLCTEPCPTEAIRMTTEFEYSEYNRDNLLYHFSDMSAEMVEQKRKMLAEFDAKQKAEKAAAAAAAAKKTAEEAAVAK